MDRCLRLEKACGKRKRSGYSSYMYVPTVCKMIMRFLSGLSWPGLALLSCYVSDVLTVTVDMDGR